MGYLPRLSQKRTAQMVTVGKRTVKDIAELDGVFLWHGECTRYRVSAREARDMRHSNECTEMNDRSAQEICTCDVHNPAYIPSDGYADGGIPYTKEELAIINQRQAMKDTARGIN